ncbi:hypothetical protein Nepgr_026725 [Nepenthes gracilis]|uniref:Uncharacterized protein n=1 Tax=Nepenthes gracilis TaxID=150966 RepID=A0AAD3Y0M9_NEPGR|nr:hypothetical protein Nepgr_026725 [Nepenthes gracilis]
MWKQSNSSFYHRKMKNDDRTKQDLGIDFRAQSAPLFLSYWPSSSSSFLDLGIYFRATATEEVLGILVASSIVLLPTLLPVAITDHRVKSDNSASNGTFSDLGKLSMGYAYKHVSDLRAVALMSLVVKPEQFAVLVKDIPPTPDDETTKEQFFVGYGLELPRLIPLIIYHLKRKLAASTREHLNLNEVGIVGEDTGWDDKCANLLDDPAEIWSFKAHSEHSTAKHICTLQKQQRGRHKREEAFVSHSLAIVDNSQPAEAQPPCSENNPDSLSGTLTLLATTEP